MLTTYKEMETQLLELAEEILEHRYASGGRVIFSPEAAEKVLQNQVGCDDYTDDTAVVLLLSPMKKLLDVVVIETAHSGQTKTTPAAIARAALMHGASSVVVGLVVSLMQVNGYHRELCCRIAVALDLVGVTFTDFVLTDEMDCYSFSENKERSLPRPGDDGGEDHCEPKAA